MSVDQEPLLDSDDIQGHIFPGFGSKHSLVAAFRLSEPPLGRAAVGRLLPDITRMAAALEDKEARRTAFAAGKNFPKQANPSLAVAFSANVFRQWNLPDTGFDVGFRESMLHDLPSIGDPLNANNQPEDWLFGATEESRIDLLLIAGHSSETVLADSFGRWRRMIEPVWELVHCDKARRRPGDKEWFGFNDGISQPAMRGLDANGAPVSRRTIATDDERSEKFARPGQRLVWPGSFIFGYEREASGSVESGAVLDAPQTWMRNGSYLVYRRLSQKVKRFKEAVANLKAHLGMKGVTVTDDWIEARLVGRWPDGAPIILSPDEPNEQIGCDKMQNNNFQYQFGDKPTVVVEADGTNRTVPATNPDPLGKIVPQVAHVRQVNPREGRSDVGPENHALKLMLRRGITFGDEIGDDEDGDRGLIFLAYQTSIADQFLFVQQTWANSSKAPVIVGPDPIIGQDGSKTPQRSISIPDLSGRKHRCPFHGRWVIPTAGAYLFAPGIKGLKEITQQLLVASAATVSAPDDLTLIKGIGPVINKRFEAVGITSFGQLASLSEGDIARLDEQLLLGKRFERYDWVKQARRITQKV